MPSPSRRSPLFRAVVVAGAALTQAVACGGGTQPSPETASDANGPPARDAAAGGDGEPHDADPGVTDAGKGCPDGSELPVPPCHYIR